MFIFPVELPQAGPLLCRGNLFTLEESECVEALLSSLMSCGALPLLGFSAAPLMKVLTFIVCAAALSVCFPFLPRSHHSLPWGRSAFVSFGSRCPWPFPRGSEPGGASAPVLLALPCPARCSFSDSRTGFLGEILFPWRHLSSHGGRQSNVGKGLEPFGD